MSKKEIILKIDAALATDLNIGDEVKEGDYVGLDANTNKPLIISKPGTVESIAFDSEEHCFSVIISQA